MNSNIINDKNTINGMFNTVNQVQGASIEAALQKREVTVSDELKGKILMTAAETDAISVFEGKGVSTTPKRKRRKKLTPERLHQLEFLFEYEDENKTDDAATDGIPFPQPLADEVYEMLPKYYVDLPMEQSDVPQLRDAVLHSVFTITSAAMSHCRVVNAREEYSCNIMSLFAATSTSGKALLTSPADGLTKISRRLREEEKKNKQEYDKKMNAYRSMQKHIESKCKPEEMEKRLMELQEPEPPFSPSMFIASKTSPDLNQRLHNNRDLPCLMRKTEMINLIKDDKKEHGGLFDCFLDIADNARMERTIKTNDEWQCAEHPNMSFVSTMTDDELPLFFSSIPSGLEARISMRLMYIDRRYRPEDDEEYLRHKQVMTQMSDELYDLYFLLRRDETEDETENETKRVYTLKFTPEIKSQMDLYFDRKERYVSAHYRAKNAVGVVFRSRLDYKRLLLQLSLMHLREMTGSWEAALSNYEIVPTVEDADLMLYYINHVIDHSLYVLESYGGSQQAYEEVAPKMSLMEMYRQLSDNFSSSDAKKLFSENGVGKRQHYRILNSWKNDFFIEETGAMGKERVFRKLSVAERRNRCKVSLKKNKKKQLIGNKQNKKK